MPHTALVARLTRLVPLLPPLLLPGLLTLLSGCSAIPEPVVSGPYGAPPVARPAQVERAVTGSLFQADAPVASLFSGLKLPRVVGDTLKVDIAEAINASSKLTADRQRDNALAVKGPGQGAKVPPGLLRSLLDLDATASGSDSYKGSGTTEHNTRFNAKIAVTVVNVLPNGHLVVAGERAVAFNKGLTTLRFSGVVNPADVGAGNVVASADVVNARLEAAGEGELADTTSRTWLQRVMAKAFSVW